MRIRLIPATIATATLLLGVKVVDITRGTDDLLIGRVSAEGPGEEKPAAVKPPEGPKSLDDVKPSEKIAAVAAAAKKEQVEAAKKAMEAKKEEDAKKTEEASKDGSKKEDAKKEEGGHEGGGEKKADNIPQKKSAVSDDAGETVDRRFTTVEVELLENLARRREELDHWEENIQIKDQALNATEKRINEKIEQIDAMKKEVGELLAQYNEKEDAKIRSLVKIYESMKPGDAARIFDEVEMPILLLVIDKMAEKKAAPILAAMNPKKAKQITVELAEQRRINTSRIGIPGGPVPLQTSAAAPPAAAPATGAR